MYSLSPLKGGGGGGGVGNGEAPIIKVSSEKLTSDCRCQHATGRGQAANCLKGFFIFGLNL